MKCQVPVGGFGPGEFAGFADDSSGQVEPVGRVVLEGRASPEAEVAETGLGQPTSTTAGNGLGDLGGQGHHDKRCPASLGFGQLDQVLEGGRGRVAEALR